MKKEIGGYFGLELAKGKEYYPDLIKLNTSRNCLEYILKVRKYKKIYIPYYTCEVILEPINKLDIKYEFYSIDKNLNIVFDKTLVTNEVILINNYFGVNSKKVEAAANSFKNVIVDNCQAFYDKPIKNIDTFYSPRKFFGVPDGAYLSIDSNIGEEFPTDKSYLRMDSLLKRIDETASFSYNDFKKKEDSLNNNPMKKMSKLTRSILQSVNYDKIRSIRKNNFLYLHKFLERYNELDIDITNLICPMVYPLLITKQDIREYLIKNKVYVATYWPNVFDWTNHDYIEFKFAKYILPLPIDQRYTNDDMKLIIDFIMKFIK